MKGIFLKKVSLIILIIFLLVLILFKVFNIYNWCLKKIYPDMYAEFVDKYSREYGIEREWIFSLIKTESNFKSTSISRKGAIGLMQLMEKTGEEISNEIGLKEIDLCDVETNIQIGTKYFADLIKCYNRKL